MYNQIVLMTLMATTMIMMISPHCLERIIMGTPRVGAERTCMHAGREGNYAHAHYTVKGKVKIMFTLEQAMKTQRGSRDIALLFP